MELYDHTPAIEIVAVIVEGVLTASSSGRERIATGEIGPLFYPFLLIWGRPALPDRALGIVAYTRLNAYEARGNDRDVVRWRLSVTPATASP